MNAPIRIEMLGGLRIWLDNTPYGEQGRVITRFSTYKTAALLAYLAYHLKRPPHPREALTEMLWPDTAPEAGRASLRAALASLRRQLEPPNVAAASVLVASRFAVHLHPQAITTDVAEWIAALKATGPARAATASDIKERLQRLNHAVSLYAGELLPGFYEEWTLIERERLSVTYCAALRELIGLSEAAGDVAGAISAARRITAANVLDREAHHTLIRLLVASGQRDAAFRQYAELEQVWKREFHALPEKATRLLIAQARSTEPARPHPAQTATLAPSASRHAFVPDTLPASPLLPADAPILPLTLTRFFGREAELAQMQALLAPNSGGMAARLVTLTGPGGSGKTRLALEAARRLAPAYGQCVVFASLADVSDPSQIFRAVADSLRSVPGPVGDAGNREPLEQILRWFAPRPAALLMLDNYEALVSAEGAVMVQTLLTRLPALTCLVTSRQRLGMAGERELPVTPLPTPVESDTPERLLQFPSVQLWTDRAQAARPDFQITPRNAPAVAALCSRLEGLPLALELAASWAQMLTPAQMLARLASRFDLLVSRHRDTIPRHHSLRAVLDSSYQHLPPAVQTFFAALSVFRGWTLEAAEAVCQAEDVLEHLTRLRIHSLVFVEESGDEMRYRMLETVREYAEERLDAEDKTELALRHSAYFVALAEAAEPELRGEALSQWLVRLEAEQGNMRLALAQGETNPEAALRLAGALGRFWYLRGHWSEGRSWLRNALERSATPRYARARALLAAANLAWTQDAYGEANRLCTESLTAYREQGDTWGIASSLSLLGMLAVLQGEPVQARRLLEESVTLFEGIGDRWGLAHTLDRLSYAVRDAGEYAQAVALDHQSLALRRELGDQHGVAVSISNLADMAFLLGDLDEAARLHAESLAGFRSLDEPNGTAYALSKLGLVALRQGDLARAESLGRESLAQFWEMQDQRRVAGCLETLACIRHLQNQCTEAARLLGAANAIRESIGAPLTDDEQADWKRSAAAISNELGEEVFARAWQRGRTAVLSDIITSLLQKTESPH